MKIVTVLGARPQFIKAAVVSAALRGRGIAERIIHTGQHWDARMSDVFFVELGLPPPDLHLGIGGLGHGAMTGRMLEALESALIENRPDRVLVYGDTNSTLAGALAAAKLCIPVAHAEAGMRSFERRMPEEINRVATDHISDLLFCTSETPARLLAAEGIRNGVHVVGDPMYDAVLRYGGNRVALEPAVEEFVGHGRYGVVTLHRQENTDDLERLSGILRGLERVSRRLPLVFPCHPRTRKVLTSEKLAFAGGRVLVIEPAGYFEMHRLLRGASIVLTDSGGVQKEAFYHSVPCITLRDETEWTETVELGWNHLTGADSDRIASAADTALDEPPEDPPPPVYGDGRASERIAALIESE
jgi:UDP-GlcNAc3NAcA epimerase